MFNSYIKMLTGLSINEQGAQYCFNLLSSDGSIGRSSTCSATWDHFFQSFKQYYASLKQDVHSTGNTSRFLVVIAQLLFPQFVKGKFSFSYHLPFASRVLS